MGKTIVFIDCENLVFRYQAMVAAGYVPLAKVSHIPDIFVWSSEIPDHFLKEIVRVWCYTSAVGDEAALREVQRRIADIGFYYARGEYSGDASLVPRVFKKERKSQKSRLVDIHIVIDAMRHSFAEGVDQLMFLTGDGDFVALFEEIMRRGKTVHVGAFSSGLDQRIPTLVDRFFDLDQMFFQPKATP